MRSGPELNHYGFPVWFFHKGTRMGVAHNTQTELLLACAGASIRICCPKEGSDSFEIHWSVDETHGFIRCSSSFIQKLLGNSSYWNHTLLHRELTERTGADFFIPGLGCRWQNFVTLPGIGTGVAFDSNVSIFLTDEIRNAVEAFLKTHTKQWLRSSLAG